MDDRYAVVDISSNTVVNVIAWDGQAQWTPPQGYRIQKDEDVAIGDIWIDSLNQFVRPLSLVKPPEDEISIAERRAMYSASKAILKTGGIFIKPEDGTPDLNP
jgi:hypothetical protein